MSAYGAVIMFIMIWWITFLCVLPWNSHSQAEYGEHIQGTDHGAPIKTGMKLKLIVTTLITAILWGTFLYVFDSGLLDIAGTEIYTQRNSEE